MKSLSVVSGCTIRRKQNNIELIFCLHNVDVVSGLNAGAAERLPKSGGGGNQQKGHLLES